MRCAPWFVAGVVAAPLVAYAAYWAAWHFVAFLVGAWPR